MRLIFSTQLVLFIKINFLFEFGFLTNQLIDEKIDIDHEKNKYLIDANKQLTIKWNKYYELIANAKYNYSENNKHISDDSLFNDSCKHYLNLIESDLKIWSDDGVSEQLINESKYSKRGVHYQIIDHQLYRDRDCMFPSRCDGVQHFILNIINELPDMDLIINVRDYPQVHHKWQALPIFSFSKEITQYIDITYPAWSFWCGGPAIDGHPTGIGRWDLMRERIVNSVYNIEWKRKHSIAYFRGSRTSSERDPLILMSRKNPNLIDAKYTKNQAWRSLSDSLGEQPVPVVSFEEQCRYKYLFNLRGVAASFRYKHLFLCKSLVLNVQSNWIEFFYSQLKPWIHYVPISSDFSDVHNILEFLNENDSIAENIANEGFNFIWKYLTLDSIQCYWEQLLKRYAKLLTYKPKLDNNLIKIKSIQ